jgi:hypothetical protein
MKLSTCVGCGSLVLELDGQFAKLDSLFIRGGRPPPESAGYWHLTCLRDSQFGPAWHQARVDNFCSVRGYRHVADVDGWTVIRDPRGSESIVIGPSGELLQLPASRKALVGAVDGFVVRTVEPDFHLELADAALVDEIKQALRSRGTYGVLNVLDALGIGDRVSHPEVLRDAVFRFKRDLEKVWTRHSVSATCEYGVFFPHALEAF